VGFGVLVGVPAEWVVSIEGNIVIVGAVWDDVFSVPHPATNEKTMIIMHNLNRIYINSSS
jgi:hypothetical protein